ncbi:hypothetical protein ANOM_004626 [Aspergillus nomiae NRRL 13137]|uniref:Cytochrome b5 heme-binding domain-containing protein n=1 Tax=Aspergillus nomiae NRRL (strain ATCC 15546 / NRRL 13137 / CBS 260.88 / M93) TaxID=1509407 RepID=A0A0L1J8N7_ASPN3|nr:uncharacterized protein ANOM_004626 [Aspergillus nomiae NRRL 13137]KNG87778.1 hypothetical protein ANOM_004626 [Aspergillus nomiae NRRL 13137]
MTILQVTVLFLVFTLAYTRSRRSGPVASQTLPSPGSFRTFTPSDLLDFNGTNGKGIYIAVRGRVFDVSTSKNFYGPGGPYENFAGRDATRGLALQSFDKEVLTKDLNGPLDDIKDLTRDELGNLESWEERFLLKYPVVGELVSNDDFELQQQTQVSA